MINPGGPSALELGTPMLHALMNGHASPIDAFENDEMPLRNDALLEAVEILAREGASALARFYSALMQRRLLVVSRRALGPPGEMTWCDETQVQLRTVTAANGRSLLAGFTDRGAALARGYTDSLIGMFAKTLLEVAMHADGMVINPSGPFPTEITREQLQYLLGKRQPN